MNIFKKVYIFYKEGLLSMTIGKTLWLIIVLKLFFMFVILKIFFFPNFLNSKFEQDNQKAIYVRDRLISPIENK